MNVNETKMGSSLNKSFMESAYYTCTCPLHVHVHVHDCPCTCTWLSMYVIIHSCTGNGFQMFLTEEGDLFNRTFKNNEYFYCENCKMYNFYHINQSICDDCVKPCVNNSKNETVCSNVHMKKSVIYVKDPSDGKSKDIVFLSNKCHYICFDFCFVFLYLCLRWGLRGAVVESCGLYDSYDAFLF